MIKKLLFAVVNILLCVFVIYLTITTHNVKLSCLIKNLIIICETILIFLMFLFELLKYQRLSRFLIVTHIGFAVTIISYLLLLKFDIFSTFTSINGLKEYILSTKERGVFVYIFIQMAQVVILPIPAAVICIVGSLIYGPLLGAVYCSVGILVGSYISYFLGKTCGYRVVVWLVGKESTDKYSKILKKRGVFFLAIAFLLPMFPDDILCLIAGITGMTFSSFFWVTLITRPMGVICMSYFGSGHIIPFTGWGVYAWILILIVAIFLVVSTYKYQDKMQEFVMNKIFKSKKSKLKKKS